MSSFRKIKNHQKIEAIRSVTVKLRNKETIVEIKKIVQKYLDCDLYLGYSKLRPKELCFILDSPDTLIGLFNESDLSVHITEYLDFYPSKPILWQRIIFKKERFNQIYNNLVKYDVANHAQVSKFLINYYYRF